MGDPEYNEEVEAQVQMLVDVRNALMSMRGRIVPIELREEVLGLVFDFLTVSEIDKPKTH